MEGFMQVEWKDIGRAIKHVSVTDLIVGHVYFVVRYHGSELLVPELAPVVFIGKDLAQGDQGFLYFQDFASYSGGERFGDGNPESVVVCERFSEAQGASVCSYESAVDELLRCLLRRKEIGS